MSSRSKWSARTRALRVAATLVGSVALFTAVLGVAPAAAAAPTWPGSKYMGVLQNVPFTLPIATTSGGPLTAMTVNSAPANVAGFGLANVDLVAGTADMVGTYTGAPNGSSVTASIKAVNSSGNTNGSFTLEAYSCSWTSSAGSSTAPFDTNQAEYVTGSQSAYGAAITDGVTAGITTLSPACADLHALSLGATELSVSNPFSSVITPGGIDNTGAESDLASGCGVVSIVGTNTGNFNGNSCNGSRTVPATWANGGALGLSIGTQSDVGDTDLGLTACPPSQAAVDAGLVTCSVTGSTDTSSYSWNYTSDQFLYNGQNLPQTTTAALSSDVVVAGGNVAVAAGANWWGNAAGAPVAGTGHTQTGSYYSIPSPGVFIGTSRATATPATTSTVQVSGVTYTCGQASSTVAPNPCTFTPGDLTGSFVVPASLAPGSYNVYIDEANTTPLMGNGPDDAFQAARGAHRGTVESVTPISVKSVPTITSADSTAFTRGSAGTFSVTSTATPTAALSESGALPDGVTFNDNGDGTATLAGVPAADAVGTYPLSIAANNGFGADNQSFVLTVAPTVPDPPTALSATPGNGSVSVALTPPGDDGGSAISSYTATCVSSDGGVTGSGSAAASPVVVSGLTNGNTYSCTAIATNDAGPSVPSAGSNYFLPTSCSGGFCVSVGDQSVYEGDAGTHTMTFPVTLSHPATSTVTVHYTLVGDTTPGYTATGGAKATSGVDFKVKTGTLTFTPGATGLTPISKAITATVFGDTTIEPDQTFGVILSSPSGAGVVLGRNTATGTIRNDDGSTSGITMGIGDASIVNATAGKQNLKLPVTLSTKASGQISVTYTITPGSATYSQKSTAGGDFGGKTTGTLTFTVGSTGFTANVKPISIPIWPDANPDPNESFTIALTNLTGTGVSLINATATATILAS